MMSEADIIDIVKALMRKHKVSKEEACAFVLSFGWKRMMVFEDIEKAFVKGMGKVQHLCNHMNDRVALHEVSNNAYDASRVDYVIRKAAMQEPNLNIHFEDCSDLTRQLEECKRRAGVR